MIRNRAMTRAELDTVLDWAAEEGWNPGLDDADAFWAADPEGVFVAEEDGAPVAAISVVNHGPRFAFLGLYLCRPSHRGRGIGLGLWRHALAHAGARTVGLDGVPEQQANYEASGFRRTGQTVRYHGRLSASHPEGLRPVMSTDIPALVVMEAAASGWSKPAYMTAWFTDTETRRTLVLEREGTSGGMVTVRRCRSGAKVGPLVAPDADTALDMLGAAASVFEGDLSVDVPEDAAGFAARLRAIGFLPVFGTSRMYRGTPPGETAPGPVLRGVASLELG